LSVDWQDRTSNDSLAVAVFQPFRSLFRDFLGGAMNKPIAVVLAAGKGTRMKSDLAKVLFPVCGRPMVHYVLDALEACDVAQTIVVVGYQADRVRDQLAGRGGLEFVVQAEQLGTGHAVQMSREFLVAHDGPVIVVAGDSPLLQSSSLQRLLTHFQNNRPALLLGTLVKDQPHGLGRIVRDAAGSFVGIVEEKDATDQQKQIREVNMSTYVFNSRDLVEVLDRLSNDNAQGEFYITDAPKILLQLGRDVEALPVLEPCESLSINTPEELLLVESKMQEMGYQRA
jgi:bifunctional UDP-N-acetylglucosamine pyrophosphorylase/glucosamine-1-phosphate N-acetyltransferase/UDP-N-acetylglucosamine pyrophosphorylase